jgi:hypothetical protein
VPITPTVPPELLAGPFTVAEAARVGVTHQMLRGRSWVRLTRGVYCHESQRVDDNTRLAAMRLVLPEHAIATDLLAAWAHGVWRPAPGAPLPLQWAVERGRARPRESLDGSRRMVVPASDVVTAGGLVCTSPSRTCFQLMRRACLVEAVVVADAFAGASLVRLPEFYAYVDSHRRWPGVEEVRRRLEHATSASRSPGETRLRMVAVLGGLPEPYVNVPMYRGEELLGYPDLLLVGRRCTGVEYDGAYHETPLQRRNDLRRENRFLLGGLPLLRYDRFTVSRHVLRQQALGEMARSIRVDPLGDLRPEWFSTPRRPYRW